MERFQLVNAHSRSLFPGSRLVRFKIRSSQLARGVVKRIQLTLGGFCSSEPRFGHLRSTLPIRWRRKDNAGGLTTVG
jgi:hypothetical protein